MRFIGRFAALALLGALASGAGAAPVVVSQTLGGIDSFGSVAGGLGNQGGGELFDSFLLDPSATGPTDALVEGGAVLRFSAMLPLGAGPISHGRLVLRTAGFGLFGPASVKVNGVVVGTLTDADQEDATQSYQEETVQVDIFDNLHALAGLSLTGDDTVEILAVAGPDPLYIDAGAIDYAILALTYDGGTIRGGGSVPEPATLALALFGFAAAAASRRVLN